MKREMFKEKVGISLISLIITIIVIIILAAIVIFTGLNTPDRAQFARYTQEVSDFQTAITQDFMNRKVQYALDGKSRSDSQIYYTIATKKEPEDINLTPSGEDVFTLEELGVSNLNLQ